MMAAITAVQNKNDVILLEKMESLGKKLLITGKGRCNITNNIDIQDFFKNITGNSKFLYSVFNNFTNQDIINFIEENGVKTKVERGNRVFPVSDKSQDVLDVFRKKLKNLNVSIRYNSRVQKILVSENKVIGVKTEDGIINADKVILATGGKSYSVTGSTGDGYKMAKDLGHTITKLRPSLVPLTCNGKSLELCKKMQGLSLKNVNLKIKNENKVIYEDFGEMLFTHFGISGPIVLSASSTIGKCKEIDTLLEQDKIKAIIDLKPALSIEKLDARLLRDFKEMKNREFRNALDKLLPQKMIEPFIELTKINPEKRVNEITKAERMIIIQQLKEMTFVISGFRDIEEAIVTSGGISTKEINPKTMESKLIQGLYFAGEIIDIDAETGGFNLQIAFSTGYTAGLNN